MVQDSQSQATTNFVPIKAIAAASIVAVLYYQFPKARGILSGTILILILAMLLRSYPTIRSEFIKISKG